MVLAAVAVLSGCSAITSVNKDYVLSKDKKEGLVVISFTQEKGPMGAYAVAYLNGGSSDPNGAMLGSQMSPLAIPVSDPKDRRRQVFVLPLPPGSHAFTTWQVATQHVRYFPKSSPPLTFEVKAGEAIYLGNLNAHFGIGRNLLGIHVLSGGFIEVRDEFENDEAVLEQRYPQFKGRLVKALLRLGPWLGATDELSEAIETPLPIVMPVPKK
jgi:hypothetical protein